MSDFRQFFKNKKITVMGLGILGRGLGYTKFLAECGADLIVTDLKTKKQLLTSIKELSKYKNIKYTLGKHDLRDFKDRDMILKSAGVPIDSIYIKEARKNKIPIKMDVSLFVKLSPAVRIVGVTGTRGKSMTTALTYEILKQSEKFLGVKVHIGGNVRGVATLPLLKKVKAGDILVAELDSWQLQGFGDDKISPHISVFTSFMPDHMNYYMNNIKNYFADKANIFKYQKENDVLIVRPDVKKIIPKNIKSKLIVVGARNVTKYKFTVPGKFQKENLACAVEVARQFDISVSRIGKIIKNFKGLEGRLQYIKTVKGIKIYNDNNATIPKATIGGIEALSVVPKDKNLKKKIILICGGSNKNLDLGSFVKVVNKFCKAIIFIPGTGTDVLRKNYELKIPYEMTKDLKNAVQKAMKYSQSGDIILFSPAFASFGMFNNEYERNDLFMKIIKRLK
ncbi:MAG: UDP-N-acetylmuramoylalanine-D-glutamate ligase [Candidatus Nomurabacteria bacterium GW2011_GWC2_41_8]|uniref:UDP-N-acetylmuramoylalanine--D-glutamate ligase n=3 Tax=Candidatus Nomuraibacteriota TaxID=1752729 RepID=A0A1F6YCW6_9BACT|nr:MAG: UDP-N-acetylmuramoylalanine-D-glutamate ligase [Candidatus Nomurabacteria bacterium GW2011_GWA2_41_25]KKS24161.1 MAG: UDP-N-acetylmuramoylalanine-D-glutamate ligase [Candidatus Nomurabacteria bacterium GW2011_GWC2_41_8]OGI67440.1 MAG: UDP-N-acetylmuramoylalanine--D-glutamate ligase [Candidatus Nomurabacteria bacterium RIFCSPHIGHO2_01_FULL_41_91]OGI80549.1 MAG: UDP-N-acetylmuramoylalanine--D-glutamate ligase [Candidatus Nomurabacteria bacterium RIFCSPHIGHO2_02_FULL_41_52]OGI84671.1 MAG: 